MECRCWRNSKAQLEGGAAYRNHLEIGDILNQGKGITHQVIRTRKSYMTNDVSKDPNYTNLEIPVHTCSELSSPVIKDGDVVAVLNIESDQPKLLTTMIKSL